MLDPGQAAITIFVTSTQLSSLDIYPTTVKMSASSTMAAQNKAALDYFVQTPVTREMVTYLARVSSDVIRCDQAARVAGDLPTPPTTPPNGQASQDPNLPPVEAFITSIVQQSHVQVPTLMPVLVYLARLRSRLPPVAQGIPSTVHRIFLAALILAAKNLNDSSPKNKHWARYTTVPGYPNFSFSNTEVNLMEKQLLYLLDWDLRITNDDLYTYLEPFLAPIRAKQQQHAERKLQILLRERQAQDLQLRQQHFHQQSTQAAVSQISLPHIIHQSRNQRSIYDSPQAIPTTESPSVRSYTTAHSRSGSLYPASRSSSRAPSRTPSLSPPTRCDSSASYASSIGTPATPQSMHMHVYPTRPQEAKVQEGSGYYDEYNMHSHMQAPYAYGYDMPEVVHIQPVHLQKALPAQPPGMVLPTSGCPVPEEKPAKRMKTSLGGLVSRYLGACGNVQVGAC